eukprot:TRINITY_DN22320_c0_g1_i1.p1 TRINITY_DN22320_c0_g1~~TRINITY_DN22320_c0_g1_i1.p1  ORF type:complete len:548 (-),score=126.65 TRINITY_DN22320_c0_g1_i1:46-1689(-)
MLKVNVKWGKTKFSDVELDTTQSLEQFKCQLFSLSFIPAEKQKVMYKGKVLKDDVELDKLPGLKNGAIFGLLGTAEGQELKAVKVKTRFVEDLTEEEKQELYKEIQGMPLPVGLENLGNTCYLNSVLQVLFKVKEIQNYGADLIPRMQTLNQEDPKELLPILFLDLYSKTQTTTSAISPQQFMMAILKSFPQFDVPGEGGVRMQQDAEEAFSTLVESMESQADRMGSKVFENLFKFTLETTMKNTENEEEEPTMEYEISRKLYCHIDNQNNPINNMFDGFKLSLEGTIEKNSPTLERNAVYNKVQKISSLPSYFMVQFVRFVRKGASVYAGTKETNTKLLRAVSYPRVLDVYEFCSDTLKAELDKGRAEVTLQHEEETEAMLSNKDLEEEKEIEDKSLTDKKPVEKKKKKKGPVINDESLYRQHGLGLDTGRYELVGVVTHKGRAINSGHYIGWTHQKDDTWCQFDDDIVKFATTEEILDLKGGGDWHTAYILLYRRVEIIPKQRAHKEEIEKKVEEMTDEKKEEEMVDEKKEEEDVKPMEDGLDLQ